MPGRYPNLDFYGHATVAHCCFDSIVEPTFSYSPRTVISVSPRRLSVCTENIILPPSRATTEVVYGFEPSCCCYVLEVTVFYRNPNKFSNWSRHCFVPAKAVHQHQDSYLHPRFHKGSTRAENWRGEVGVSHHVLSSKQEALLYAIAAWCRTRKQFPHWLRYLSSVQRGTG